MEELYAEWIKDLTPYITPGGTPYYICSNCGKGGHLYGVEFPESYEKCPDCGAIMINSEKYNADLKKIFWDFLDLSEEKIKELNKKLVKKYPFLLPRNITTGEVVENYDYSWTLLDDVPNGWRITIMPVFLDHLRMELIKYDYLDKYFITQIKEKFGELRWYDAGYPEGSKVDDIIEIYSLLSGNVCVGCGRPNVPMVYSGWIIPSCLDCWIKGYYNEDMVISQERKDRLTEEATESYNSLASKNSELSTKYDYTEYSKDGKKDISIDIQDQVYMINHNWKMYLLHKGE